MKKKQQLSLRIILFSLWFMKILTLSKSASYSWKNVFETFSAHSPAKEWRIILDFMFLWQFLNQFMSFLATRRSTEGIHIHTASYRTSSPLFLSI